MVSKQNIILKILINPKTQFIDKNKHKHKYQFKKMIIITSARLSQKIQKLKLKRKYRILSDMIDQNINNFIINF